MESNIYWRRFITKLYLVSLTKDKDPSIRLKMNQTYFFYFYHYLPYICWLSGCDLFNMYCLSKISLMASLDFLCSNTLNLKNKITKIEHEKIFCGPSKILKNISWPINICLKYFMTPTKTLRLPLLHT